MPKKLQSAWRDDLGDMASEIHGEHFNRMCNLVLTTPQVRARMDKNETFQGKRHAYEHSTIESTSKVADEKRWDKAAMDRRSEYLSNCILEHWPWPLKPR